MFQHTDGTNAGQFGRLEWGMVATVALLWGSSFLWIAIGIESFAPGIVAWLRLVFGVAILSVLSRGRRMRIDRSDWPAIAVVGLIGNAGPALLFALAEQRVESAVVGMITGATPIVTLVLAIAIGTRSLRRVHIIGLALGFGGIVLMSAPNLTGEASSVLGMSFVFMAVVAYSINSVVLGPLQQKYGGVTVIKAAQMLGVVAMTPFGIEGLGESSFTWRSFGAVAILGIFGTGIARSMFANLIGRTGPARAQVVGYLVPVTAIVLGVAVLSETVSGWELSGLAIVLVGAFLTTRSAATPAPAR
jgi:drug/metabolite transporter (DMT)-like permease